MIKNKKNAIAITITVLFALVIGFGLGGAYSNMQQQSEDKAYNDYVSYAIYEEERLNTTATEDEFAQLPQDYQEQQINKIPDSLTGKQEQVAYMLAYRLADDFQALWDNVN